MPVRNPFTTTATTGARADLASLVLERSGWDRNLSDVEGAVSAYNCEYEGVGYVADGRDDRENPDRAWLRTGRGTTLIDLACIVRTESIMAWRFLSVKTDRLTPKGGFPSKVEVCTGTPETVQATVDAALRGAALPTVVWVSKGKDHCDEEGFVLFLDIGALIRAHGVEDGTFRKGTTPPVWRRFSSARNCGATGRANRAEIKAHGHPISKGGWQARKDLEFPYIDAGGCQWSAPWRKHYPQLFVGISKRHLAALGLQWEPCNLRDLPAFVEKQSWIDMEVM